MIRSQFHAALCWHLKPLDFSSQMVIIGVIRIIMTQPVLHPTCFDDWTRDAVVRYRTSNGQVMPDLFHRKN